jgi:hypothetical protein
MDIGHNGKSIAVIPEVSKYLYKCQIDHIVTNGITNINSLDKAYTDFIDNYLKTSKQFNESFIRRIYFQANTAPSNYEGYIERKEWYVDRLETIKLRLQNNIPVLIVELLYRPNPNYESIIINSWDKLEQLLNKHS